VHITEFFTNATVNVSVHSKIKLRDLGIVVKGMVANNMYQTRGIRINLYCSTELVLHYVGADRRGHVTQGNSISYICFVVFQWNTLKPPVTSDLWKRIWQFRGKKEHSKANPILHYPTFTFTTINYKKVTAGLKR
jgi:hypothetical protein